MCHHVANENIGQVMKSGKLGAFFSKSPTNFSKSATNFPRAAAFGSKAVSLPV
jgi:hypothetical protein